MLYHPFLYKPETGAGGTPPSTTPPAGDPPVGDPPAGSDQAAWEAWLAKQTEDVRKMYEEHTSGLKSALKSERDKAKAATDQAKRLAELEEAEKKRKESELSELQKAQTKQAELEKQIAQQAEALKSTRLRHAVEIAAARANFQDPEDAYRLADLSEVEVSEDGKVTGVDKALEALAKKRPYLIKTTKAPETDAEAGGKKKPGSDETAIARRFGLS